jgi:hypothetical protein
MLKAQTKGTFKNISRSYNNINRCRPEWLGVCSDSTGDTGGRVEPVFG